MQDSLKSLTIGSSKPDACIIWLHGLGAGADDFIPAVPYLRLAETLNIKFLFPQAPTIPVTINGGWEMPAWYDILKMLPEREIVPAHLQYSAQELHRLTHEQITLGIPADKIIWIGFSQGGAVVLEAALNSQRYSNCSLPSAVMALSTYQALPSDAVNKLSVDFWHGHGLYDDVVPFAMGKKAYEKSADQGRKSTWNSYPMGHEVCVKQLEEMGGYIANCLAR
ncbi:hypothetical protein BTE48_13040 [Oceanospirillum multiglobuliferum]|uniref:Phospholipase/carboxylesterase/thioesterase domain-containing protein n=2 Tax=Oceanospirillum multiglobuliferum TaxID=64969 RepID=A0A1V4T455_9GAMM|nr:hypothetical protein BTE48_13040 [Oceanospirillum multiglobuliferum]